MAESKIKASSLVPLTNGSSDISKYKLFVVQLKDNWVTGTVRIQVMFANTGIPVRYTWDYSGYQNQFELTLSENTFSVTAQYSSTPNQNAPTITGIYGVC